MTVPIFGRLVHVVEKGIEYLNAQRVGHLDEKGAEK